MKEFSSWWVYKTFQTGALYGIVRFADWEEWLIKLGGVFNINEVFLPGYFMLIL